MHLYPERLARADPVLSSWSGDTQLMVLQPEDNVPAKP